MPGPLRIAILAAVGTFAGFCALSVIVQLWMPVLFSGIGVNNQSVVIAVESNSSAARAGVRLGDRVLKPVPPPQAVVRHLRIARHGKILNVTVVAQFVSQPILDKLVIVGHATTFFLFLGIGSMLVVLRPSRMTWAFYVYCIGWYNGTIGIVTYSPMLPSSGWHWVDAAWDVVAVAGLCGLFIFVVLFPNGCAQGWRRRLDGAANALPFFLVPASILLKILHAHGLGMKWADDVWLMAVPLVYGFIAAITIVTFLQSRGEERQRIAWTLALPVSLAFLMFHDLTVEFAPSYSLWLSGDIVVIFAACVPLAVVYALIRYRVFDISFVINRALLYGTMSVFIAMMLGGLDWLISKEAVSSRWGLALGICLASVIGFSFSTVHRRLSEVLDVYIFRMRRQTHLELERLATRLYSAHSLQAFYDLLLNDLTRALSSVNAALFEKLDDGGFLRQADVAWRPGEAWHLLPDHHLARQLNRKFKTCRIEDEQWNDRDDIPRDHRPALAVPLMSNRQIHGLLLYGAHLNGTDFDSSEIRMIETFARQAGPIYGALRLGSAF